MRASGNWEGGASPTRESWIVECRISGSAQTHGVRCGGLTHHAVQVGDEFVRDLLVTTGVYSTCSPGFSSRILMFFQRT